tara:strand:- start:1028 stop:1816 length:789 start_codon:yes stop_codon:yes gene_type:complete
MIFWSKNGNDSYINAFAKGCGCPVVHTIEKDNPEPIIFRSIVKKDVIKYRLEHNLPFYYMDTGYFGNYPNKQNPSGTKQWMRIVKNGLQHTTVKKVSSLRWYTHFNYPIQKQLKNGRHILLVLPSEKPCKFYNVNLSEWTEETISNIKKYTDRPIKIRKKPETRIARVQNTIFEDLNNCWATVTYNSIAAVESIMSGVPAFTLAPTAADPVCDKELSNLENPTLYQEDQILEWVYHLSHGQYHITELKSGIALRMLEDYESS